MLDGATLLRVEAVEIVRRASRGHPRRGYDFRFVRKRSMHLQLGHRGSPAAATGTSVRSEALRGLTKPEDIHVHA